MRFPLWKLWAPLFPSFPRHRYYFHMIYGPKCERWCKIPVPHSHVAHHLSQTAKNSETWADQFPQRKKRDCCKDGAGSQPGQFTAERSHAAAVSVPRTHDAWVRRRGGQQETGQRRLETVPVHPVHSLVNPPFSSPILD